MGIDLYGSGSIECYQSFEANIDFEVRFMVDANITSCGWIVLPKQEYSVVGDKAKVSRCQLEVNSSLFFSYCLVRFSVALLAMLSRLHILITILQCSISYKDIVAHAPDDAHEWSEIAPLRILSFDIECVGRKGSLLVIFS